MLCSNLKCTSGHVKANFPDLGEGRWIGLVMTVWGRTQGREARAEGIRGECTGNGGEDLAVGVGQGRMLRSNVGGNRWWGGGL